MSSPLDIRYSGNRELPHETLTEWVDHEFPIPPLKYTSSRLSMPCCQQERVLVHGDDEHSLTIHPDSCLITSVKFDRTERPSPPRGARGSAARFSVMR